MVEVGIEVSVDVKSGILYVGEEGEVVLLDEDGCGESDRVSVSISDTLERVMSSKMLMTRPVDDEDVSEPGCLLRSLACFLNFFAVLSISESSGNGVPIHKYLGGTKLGKNDTKYTAIMHSKVV